MNSVSRLRRSERRVRVNVKHWNPRKISRSGGPLLGRIPVGPRVNNFGDLLGPLIVAEVAARRGLDVSAIQEWVGGRTRGRSMVSIGSTMRLAQSGDVIWGTGINGKSLEASFPFTSLDVRAVRGPLSKQVLERAGIDVPNVLGDPGLLVGEFWSRDELAQDAPRWNEVTVIPNLNDYQRFMDTHPQVHTNLVHPCTDLWTVVRQIAASDFVTGSSLHAIVIAEALGVPARVLTSGSEPMFKYEDYYLGSGRGGVTPARSLSHAMDLGPEVPHEWKAGELLDAFPSDLWDPVAGHRT
jgi:pyruvyltransferase